MTVLSIARVWVGKDLLGLEPLLYRAILGAIHTPYLRYNSTFSIFSLKFRINSWQNPNDMMLRNKQC